MTDLVWLSVLAVAEAAVYRWRIRTAVAVASHHAALRSAASTGLVCLVRIAFVWLGASAVMRGEAAVVVVMAYVWPAVIADYLLHRKLSWPRPWAKGWGGAA